MDTEIELGDIRIEVVQKDIKNVHLSVHPPSGKVRISVPLRMKMNAIRAFAISKLAWIKEQQRKFAAQERDPEREYLDRESHYVWGKRYLLRVVESGGGAHVELRAKELLVYSARGTSTLRLRAILENWYRRQVKEAALPIIEKWSSILGVRVEGVFVQKMKTRWGGCNQRTGNIRLNASLGQKPPEHLEYVVLHEMVHLIEPTHNQLFIDLMDRYMANWRQYRDDLNRLPLNE